MISEISRSLSIDLYLRPFSIANSWICASCTYSDIFPACKLRNSGLQIMPLIPNHLRFMANISIGGFYWLGYQEGSVSILSYILAVYFLVCKL